MHQTNVAPQYESAADRASTGRASPSFVWHSNNGDYAPASSNPSIFPESTLAPPDGHGIEQDVAVVGFSFVFPGAETSSELWDLMLGGRCVATEFPADRLNSRRYHRGHGNGSNSIPCTKACFIDRDVALFDAQMFNMTALEASSTDPQQRLLLETTYRALENAGISLSQIRGTETSVHTGCFTFDFAWAITKDPEYMPKYSAPGGAVSFLSNRISTFFDLTGPSVTVDTACSSSLVALDQACRCIRQGESTMGIVTGSSLLLTQDMFFTLGNMGFLSPDGVSHSFDSRGNGYGRGEGVAALILKPVGAALRDGDTIRAIIRNTCTNQNGLTPLAVPSKQLQQRLIRKTYLEAGLDMSRTRYVEAHGTGTAVGDPLEAMAIGETFGPGRSTKDPIIIGTIKANIGHLEGAAGIAGIIKAILVLERGLIPPIAELDKLNDDIDAEFLKLQFPRTAQRWSGQGLRRASVNSFGFGGTNSHAILDDALSYLESRGLAGNHCTVSTGEKAGTLRTSDHDVHQTASESTPRLFVFSARTHRAVDSILEALQGHLKTQLQVDSKPDKEYLVSLAHTLGSRRSLHSWRVSVTADTVPNLVAQLDLAKASVTKIRSNTKVAFVLTGQGAQWLGMGQDLGNFPVFRESVLAADSFLRKELQCTWSAADFLLDSDNLNHNKFSISEPRFAQPLCTILQVALIELLRSLGVLPSAVVGHSSGEIAAAYAVCAISRESAWKLAYFRGILSSKIVNGSPMDDRSWPHGAMLAVGLSEQAVRPHLESILKMNPGGILAIACVNSPLNVTVSGDASVVEALQIELKQSGVFARILKVPVAYHSPHMERLSAEYSDLIGTLHPAAPQPLNAVMISSVTGENVSGNDLCKADYWVRNLVSTVRFNEAVSRLCHNATMKKPKKLDLSHREFVAVSMLLELGPHATLQGPIREIIQDASRSLASRIDLVYTSALVRGRPATMTLLEAIGKLHCAGCPVNLTRVNLPLSAKQPLMVLPTLPAYPFDHCERYWYEPRVSRNLRTQSQVYSEFLGAPIADYNPLEPCWRNNLRVSTMPWIADHAINGEVLFPAAGMIIMVVEAMARISQGLDREVLAYEVRDMRVFAALVFPVDDSVAVEAQLRLKFVRDPENKTSTAAVFTLFSISGEDVFTEVCQGSIKVEFARPSIADNEDASSLRKDGELRRRIAAASTSYGSQLEKPAIFNKLLANGYQFGPTFQGIDWTRRDGHGSSISMVDMQEPDHNPGSPAPTIIHPAALDRILHTTLPPVVRVDDESTGTWVPTFVRKVRLQGTRVRTEAAQVLAETEHVNKRLCVASAGAMGGERCIVDIQGIELTMVSDDELSDKNDLPNAQEKRLCFDLLYKPDISLLDGKELASLIQSEMPKTTLDNGPFQLFLELLAHKNPGMAILQIGSSIQPVAECIISTLVTQTPQGTVSKFSQYHITDCEPFLLNDASPLFEGVPKVRTSVLDVELDIATQGFADAKYDLVVVSSPSGRQSLINVRNIVKDDGYVIFYVTGPEMKHCHLLSNDFEVVREFEAPIASHEHCAILSRPSSTPPRPISTTDGILAQAKKAMIITGWKRPALHCRLVKHVIFILNATGITETACSSFNEVASLLQDGVQCIDDLIVVVVQEGSWLSLEQLADDEYVDFHTVLRRSHSLLWLGENTFNSSAAVMPFGAVYGLARALRVERNDLIFATVSLDKHCSEPLIINLLTKSLQNFLKGALEPVGHRTYERELLQVGNFLHIPRISEANKLNRTVHEATRATAVERRVRFGDQNLKLKVRCPGLMDSLCLEEVSSRTATLAPHEIEVEVKAVGVNFRDCLIALGRIDQQDLGIECAGLVCAVGGNCSNLRLGDRVLLCQADSFIGKLRCSESVAMRLPDSMSFADAGGLPTIFVTAWHGLVRVGRLAKGESVLIHSGAGGTGQAAIQVALYCGAEVYTTVGTANKRKLITELYGIPAERILNSRDLSFADDIKRLTSGKGVDLVLNSLAGDALVASWECVAPWGRFLEIGKKDILSHKSLPMFPFKRNVSFSAIDISAMINERPELLREAMTHILALLENGVLRMPVPMKVFAISEVEQAFRHLQSGTNAGKVVVEMKAEDEVTAFVKPRPKGASFGGDQTYLIAGGLGAQGKVIAKWMVDKGARFLVLLSRSGGDGSEESTAFVEKLQSRGVSVHCPPCSIDCPRSLEAVLGYCNLNMPPIKGCIQAAMDLKDSIFDNMTFEAWSAGLRPKVAGTWNLHLQLPADLDFFVMLSSVSGIIGSPGQSNYATGNTFQDTLARHRVRHGMKAVSLDFSLMAGHGYAVENRDAAVQFIKTRLVMEMTQAEILAVLSIVCDKEFVVDENHSQIVMGLELPANIAARGLDASWLKEPLFSHLHQIPSTSTTNNNVNGFDGENSTTFEQDLASLVIGAESLAEASEAVTMALADKLCKVLSLDRGTFHFDQPLHVYGVDSLIAVEVRNWFHQKLKVDLAVFEILGGGTASTLGRAAADKLRPSV